MNKPRRKELGKAAELLAQAMEIVLEVLEQEQEAYDNLPESIQDGEQGQQMDENIYDLDTLASSIDECREAAEDIIER